MKFNYAYQLTLSLLMASIMAQDDGSSGDSGSISSGGDSSPDIGQVIVEPEVVGDASSQVSASGSAVTKPSTTSVSKKESSITKESSKPQTQTKKGTSNSQILSPFNIVALAAVGVGLLHV